MPRCLRLHFLRWPGGHLEPPAMLPCILLPVAYLTKEGPPNAPSAFGRHAMARWGPPNVPVDCWWPAMAMVGAPKYPR
jgi:hypothetical protein